MSPSADGSAPDPVHGQASDEAPGQAPDPALAAVERLLRRWEVGAPLGIAGLPAYDSGKDGSGDPADDRVQDAGEVRWLIETAEEGRLLLERPAETDRRRLLFRCEVMTRLAAAGLPVPVPIASRRGGPLATAGRRAHILRPWVEGRRRTGLDLRPDECHDLGGLLGRVHSALDTLMPPVQQTLLVPVPRARDAVAGAERLLADETVDPAVRQVLEARRALLTELADHQPPDVEAVVAGHVHGDFHAGNLVFDGPGDVAAIVGWEHLRVDAYAGEVARAAVSLFARDDGQGLELELVEAFVAGHAAVFPLDAAQLRSAAHRLWWERLCDLGSPAGRKDAPLHEGTPGPDGGGLLASAALVEWWTGNLELTLDVFAAPYERPAGETAEEEPDEAAGGAAAGASAGDPGRTGNGPFGEPAAGAATRGRPGAAGPESPAADAALDPGLDPEPDPGLEFWDVDVDVDFDAGVDIDVQVDMDIDADVDLSLV